MSRNDSVFWRAAEQVLATARLANIDPRPLTRGLPFDPSTLSAARWVHWDDYCTMLERLEVACGGPDAIEELTAKHVAFSEVKALAGAFMSPTQLYAFIFRVLDPLCFPCINFGYRELADGRLHIEAEIKPHLRSCMPLMRGSIGALRAVPTHLGLPLAEVEADLDAQHTIYRVRPPLSQTILARARRRTRAALDSMTALLGEISGETIEGVTAPAAELSRGRSQARAMDGLRSIRSIYGLSDRQFEVLEEIIAGCGNKEIALRLGCAESTVELHVTTLLRKLGVHSRAQLIAKCWADARTPPPQRIRR
jgi:DNA-binding CsgD family transcriptional regulator